jgi:hypothetical protein
MGHLVHCSTLIHPNEKQQTRTDPKKNSTMSILEIFIIRHRNALIERNYAAERRCNSLTTLTHVVSCVLCVLGADKVEQFSIIGLFSLAFYYHLLVKGGVH